MNNKTPLTGVITRIEQQQKKRNRFNIYIDDQYAFSIHEDVIVSRRMSKNQEVDTQELERILMEEERIKAEHAGLRYLSYRARTKYEMKQYLLTKEYDAKLIDQVIDKWESQGYINDQQFAAKWVEERITLKKKGTYLIREELKQKGITQEVIVEAMQKLKKEEEFKACYEMLQKKQRSLERASQKKNVKQVESRQKLFAYLTRRGFPIEIIQQAYQNWKEVEDIKDDDSIYM